MKGMEIQLGLFSKSLNRVSLHNNFNPRNPIFPYVLMILTPENCKKWRDLKLDWGFPSNLLTGVSPHTFVVKHHAHTNRSEHVQPIPPSMVNAGACYAAVERTTFNSDWRRGRDGSISPQLNNCNCTIARNRRSSFGPEYSSSRCE